MAFAAEKMIFVVGNSRSGTTMLGRILGKHDEIYTFEELHFFENLVDEADVLDRPALSKSSALILAARILTSARFNIFAKPKLDELKPEILQIIEPMQRFDAVSVYQAVINYEVCRRGKRIACEQTPRYLFSLDEIFSVFPNARVINIARDPRDVMLSQKNKWRTYLHGSWDMPFVEAVRVWANYHPLLISKLWSSCIRQAEKYRCDPRIHFVRFEDLVSTPDTTVKNICEHIGVSFKLEMLEVEDIGSSIKEDRPGVIGINKLAAARWRKGGLTPSEIAICNLECNEYMTIYDYPIMNTSYEKLKYFSAFPSLIWKISLSFLLNWSRNKNIFSSIKRRFYKL